jgi:Cu-Zn family superoxide dismutase
VKSARGEFGPYKPGVTAITYDPALVPPGATAAVAITETGSSSRVQLVVTGLRPNRGYGAHLHTKPCGPTGDDAGPHFQHRHDPSASPSHPSVNPSYANAQNEVWLDVKTDAGGKASAVATHPFPLDPSPRSLIIHAKPTSTGPGEAGTAGARLACLTLPA